MSKIHPVVFFARAEDLDFRVKITVAYNSPIDDDPDPKRVNQVI